MRCLLQLFRRAQKPVHPACYSQCSVLAMSSDVSIPMYLEDFPIVKTRVTELQPHPAIRLSPEPKLRARDTSPPRLPPLDFTPLNLPVKAKPLPSVAPLNFSRPNFVRRPRLPSERSISFKLAAPLHRADSQTLPAEDARRLKQSRKPIPSWAPSYMTPLFEDRHP